jgi:hypothetical protein
VKATIILFIVLSIVGGFLLWIYSGVHPLTLKIADSISSIDSGMTKKGIGFAPIPSKLQKMFCPSEPIAFVMCKTYAFLSYNLNFLFGTNKIPDPNTKMTVESLKAAIPKKKEIKDKVEKEIKNKTNTVSSDNKLQKKLKMIPLLATKPLHGMTAI